MAVRIQGEVIDDLAKINSADIITQGTAIIGEVMQGETFYAGSSTLKTGNLATVAIVAANDNYPAGYHAGNVGGLDAIDAELAPGNIKDGITIFGKLGTFTGGALSEDTTIVGRTPHLGAAPAGAYSTLNVAALGELVVGTTTDNYAADSMAVAVGLAAGFDSVYPSLKLKIRMDGVFVAESGWLPQADTPHMLVGTRALSGAGKVCDYVLVNSVDAVRPFIAHGAMAIGDKLAMGIGVGSIKKT